MDKMLHLVPFSGKTLSQKITFLLLPLYFGKALLANFSTKVFPLLWISTWQVTGTTGTTETTEAIVSLSQYYCQQRHSYVLSAPRSWLCQQRKHSHGHTMSQIQEPILGTTNQDVEKGKKASYRPTQISFHTRFTGHLLERRGDGRINNYYRKRPSCFFLLNCLWSWCWHIKLRTWNPQSH